MDREKTAYDKLVDKIIETNEKKYGLKFNDLTDADCRSYCLYESPQIETYSQYKHYARFYGHKPLSKKELFRLHKMHFEVRTDCIFAQEMRPTKEGFLKGLDFKSSKWTNAEIKELQRYVENEVLDDNNAYYMLYGIRKEK